MRHRRRRQLPLQVLHLRVLLQGTVQRLQGEEQQGLLPGLLRQAVFVVAKIIFRFDKKKTEGAQAVSSFFYVLLVWLRWLLNTQQTKRGFTHTYTHTHTHTYLSLCLSLSLSHSLTLSLSLSLSLSLFLFFTGAVDS